MLTHDFDGDGRTDVAVGSRWESTVTVMLSLGDGRLRPGSPVRLGSAPVNLAAGDVDRDGNADIASGTNHGLVSIMLSDGQGGIRQSSSFSVGSGGSAVGLGRLDGDANIDLATTEYYSKQLRVYAGDGHAGFALRHTRAFAVPPGRPLVADVSGDGLDDVIVSTGSQVRVYVSRTDGGLAETTLEAGASMYFLLARDLDGDDRLDLIGIGQSAVTVILQPHPLEFDVLPTVPAPFSYDTWAVADDLDGDGLVDLLLGNMVLWPGSGDGTFAAPGRQIFPSRVSAAAAADLDRDERTDLVLALGERQVTTARSAGGGAFVMPDVVAGLGIVPTNAVLADLDEDGHNDLVWNRLDLIWARGNTGGTFPQPGTIPLADSVLAFAIADINRDGHLDIVATTTRDRGIVLLGNGNGTFVTGAPLVLGRSPRALMSRDLNHDGLVDLVVANGGVYYDPQSSSISVLIGNGDGTFAAERRYATSASPRELVLGDFNEDGHLDVVVTNYDSGTVHLFAGLGDGSLAPRPSVSTGPRPQGMTVADLDGDGHLDLAVAILGPDLNIPAPRGELVLLPGRGDGSFALPVRRVLGDRPADVVSVDFNFDNRPDLAVAYDTNSSATYGELVILLNEGAFDFTAERFGAGNPTSLATGDADGDVRPDVVLLNAFSSVVVYRNTGPLPPDTDGDGINDLADSCTDVDDDGFGDHGFPRNTCPPDNCVDAPNPNQADADADGQGDACDACPSDPLNDADRDAVCGDVDLCPAAPDPAQADGDGDGAGDACDPCTDRDGDGWGDPGTAFGTCPPDNCPDTPNPQQDDGNADGSGDACQPVLSIDSVAADAAGRLLATGRARDPQGEALSGAVRIVANTVQHVLLREAYLALDCSLGHAIEGVAGEGIGYSYAALAEPLLFDLDSAIGCVDAIPDYNMAPGTCDSPSYGFDTYVVLTGLPMPSPICVRRPQETAGGFDLLVTGWDEEGATLVAEGEQIVATVPFSAGVPEAIDLPALPDGAYRLEIEATDGNTLPVVASAAFVLRGERVLVLDFNAPPVAAVAPVAPVECAGPAGTPVSVDGSGSSDPDSSTGTADDIAAYEWYEDDGTPAGRHLASGRTATVTLSLGTHSLTLIVTDRRGKSDARPFTAIVLDTVPPVLDCPAAQPIAECSGEGGAWVGVVAVAGDACAGHAIVTNDRTAGGADASGDYLLGMTAVGFTAADGSGNLATCSTTVTVRDTLAPWIGALPSPQVLWPPNHGLMPVHLDWQAGDACDAAGLAIDLVSVISSEPDDAPGHGDGATDEDIQGALYGTADADLLLRAERDGSGPGRVYTARFRATDRGGNQGFGIAVVTVPHDRGDGPEPVLMQIGPADAAVPGGAVRIAWPAIAGAVGYDVIRGDLAAVRQAGGVTDLGPVAVLARTTPATTFTEPEDATSPPAGGGFFYLVQYQTALGAAGWGSAPAPWPRVPGSCAGGCPGAGR